MSEKPDLLIGAALLTPIYVILSCAFNGKSLHSFVPLFQKVLEIIFSAIISCIAVNNIKRTYLVICSSPAASVNNPRLEELYDNVYIGQERFDNTHQIGKEDNSVKKSEVGLIIQKFAIEGERYDNEGEMHKEERFKIDIFLGGGAGQVCL